MKTTLINPKTTHIDRVRSVCGDQIAEISKMLGWTEEQYCQHQYEEYERFLRYMFHGEPEARFNRARYSGLMRGFWINEWTVRNEFEFMDMARSLLYEGWEVNEKGELVEVVYDPGAESHVYDEYLFIHSFRRLAFCRAFLERYYHVLKLISRS